MTSPTSIPDHTPEFNKNFIIVIRVIIFIIIIGVGAGISYYLLTNVDEHERMPRKEREVIVNVETIKRKDKTVVISATGTVVPARAKLSLTSRVSVVTCGPMSKSVGISTVLPSVWWVAITRTGMPMTSTPRSYSSTVLPSTAMCDSRRGCSGLWNRHPTKTCASTALVPSMLHLPWAIP